MPFHAPLFFFLSCLTRAFSSAWSALCARLQFYPFNSPSGVSHSSAVAIFFLFDGASRACPARSPFAFLGDCALCVSPWSARTISFACSALCVAIDSHYFFSFDGTLCACHVFASYCASDGRTRHRRDAFSLTVYGRQALPRPSCHWSLFARLRRPPPLSSFTFTVPHRHL